MRISKSLRGLSGLQWFVFQYNYAQISRIFFFELKEKEVFYKLTKNKNKKLQRKASFSISSDDKRDLTTFTSKHSFLKMKPNIQAAKQMGTT